jgi:hypothetical protein
MTVVWHLLRLELCSESQSAEGPALIWQRSAENVPAATQARAACAGMILQARSHFSAVSLICGRKNYMSRCYFEEHFREILARRNHEPGRAEIVRNSHSRVKQDKELTGRAFTKVQ